MLHADIRRQSGQSDLTVAEVGKRLGVSDRTVRRYIDPGIAGHNGCRIKLQARLVANGNGQEYLIGLDDLARFEELRAQSIRAREEFSPAAQLVVGELEQERLHQDLQQALSLVEQQNREILSQRTTIESLALRVGEAEGENTILRQQLARLQSMHSWHHQGLIARLFYVLFGPWPG